MPELPEVEIVKRGLECILVGRRFESVDQRRDDLRIPFPPRFARRLEGIPILALTRRAKYILIHMASGEVLLVHLGMTGRFTVADEKAASDTPASGGRSLAKYVYDTGGDPRHDHVLFRVSGGTTLTFNDPRRFGLMDIAAPGQLESHPLLAGLGVEPLGPDLTADYLARRALGRRSDLKAFLLDQGIVAGLGNIYVCEALHRAGFSPRRAAGILATRNGRPAPRTARLVDQIRATLEAAIAAGGSTLRDYRHADGSAGAFQEEFLVYDREGAACVRPGCGGQVRRLVQAGRSSFYCPRCQR